MHGGIKIKIKINILKEKLIFLYCFFSVIFPVSIANKILFLIIFLFSLISIGTTERKNEGLIKAPIIILGIYTWGLMNAQFKSHDSLLARQFYFSIFIFFIIFFIKNNNIDMENIIKKTGVYIISITLFLFVLNFYFFDNMYAYYILSVFEKYSLFVASARAFGDKNLIMLHLGAAPFIYLPTYLYFKDLILKKNKIKNFILVIASFIVIILSTSRALILGSILACCICYILNSKGIKKIVFVTLIIIIGIYMISYLVKNTTIFSFHELGNDIKKGHFESYIQQLTIKNFFLGDGLATYYYSKGINKVVAHTELTAIDTARYFGVVLNFITYYFYFFPKGKFKRVLCENLECFLIFFIYVIMGSTNPILLNSFGIIIILWYWSKIVGKEEEKND